MAHEDASQDALPEITFRIPGMWEHPSQLATKLPKGYSLEPEDAPGRLILPDKSSIEFRAVPADDEFAAIFADACQRPPSKKDQQTIENYRVNVLLTGPGGSLEAAHRMMKVGAAIIKAGGAGVFIDNSGVAHGSDDWLKLASDPDNKLGGDYGGVFWAFVATFGSEDEVWSVGMHVIGFRDAVIPRTGDDQADHFMLNNFLGYSYQSGATIVDGDLLGDEKTPMFRVYKEPCDRFEPGAPMHNPYGQWRLERVGEDEGDFKAVDDDEVERESDN